VIEASADVWGHALDCLLEASRSALLRSLLTGLLAALLSPLLADWVTGHRARGRQYALAAALAPMFAPPLLVGYCYSAGVFLLVHRPLANAAVYSLLLLLNVLPVGMLVVLFAPGAPVSQTAFHCHRMLPCRPWRTTARFWFLGPLHHRLAVFAVCFLISFQEFEMASLMSIPSWTVEIFDAQAKGIQPYRTMQILSMPLLIICIAVLPAVCLLTRGSGHSGSREGWKSQRSRWPGYGLVCASNLSLWGMPLLFTARELPRSTALLEKSAMLNGFFRELSSALGFALCGAALTVVTALFLLPGATQSRSLSLRWLALATLIPGLSGALSVTLGIYLAMQSGPLSGVRTTPLPAVFGMAVFLLPRAVLMLLLFRRNWPDAAVFSAATLSHSTDERQVSGGGRILWQLEDRAVFWTFAAVFIWGFYNLTTSSLLMPVAIVPLPVRLYNLMHYGQTPSLSVQALLSVVIPFLLMSTAVGILPHVLRYRARTPFGGRTESGLQERTKSTGGK